MHLARVDDGHRRGGLEAAHARAAQPGAEAQPQRVAAARHARDVERRVDELGLDRVALAAEVEDAEPDAEGEPPPFAGRQPQAPEVEGVGVGGHVPEGRSCARARHGPRRPGAPAACEA
jgi:uncharacterized membrane protein